MDAVSRATGGYTLVTELKRLQEQARERRQNIPKPYERPKTVLDGLVPKRISGPLSEEDRKQLTEAQNLGLDLKAQRVAMEEERARKQEERLRQLEAQVRAAVQRGDMGLAKRLAGQARGLGAAVHNTVQNGSGNYTAAPTDDVAAGIKRLKAIGSEAKKTVAIIEHLADDVKPKLKDSGPGLADLHVAQRFGAALSQMMNEPTTIIDV